MERKFDLEERLIDFAVMALSIVDDLPNTYSANHLGHQLARSGTAPALLYGEAQAAESQADFIHKMGLCLKELRESEINLKIISKRNYIKDLIFLQKVQQEVKELVAIFTKSVKTAQGNKTNNRK